MTPKHIQAAIVATFTSQLASRGRTVDVVFDGPPGPEAGRFIETEDEQGRSVCIGEWIDRGNGMWALRIGISLPAEVLADCAAQAATVIVQNLDECEDCGYGHAKCRCHICMWCQSPIDGFVPSDAAAELVGDDSKRQCEDCFGHSLRTAQRRRREDAFEDYCGRQVDAWKDGTL